MWSSVKAGRCDDSSEPAAARTVATVTEEACCVGKGARRIRVDVVGGHASAFELNAHSKSKICVQFSLRVACRRETRGEIRVPECVCNFIADFKMRAADAWSNCSERSADVAAFLTQRIDRRKHNFRDNAAPTRVDCSNHAI